MNLEALENKLDKALESETKESLQAFLDRCEREETHAELVDFESWVRLENSNGAYEKNKYSNI